MPRRGLSHSEETAKTLREIGLHENKTVKRFLSNDSQLTAVILRVGEKRYTYEEYLAAHPGATAPEGGSIMDIVKIEAEFPDAISDAAVAPSNDNSSA